MADIAVVGVNIGKRLFHVIDMDQAGHVVLRRRCSRSQLFAFFERLPPALVGMEACARAHFLGRTIRDLGHDARLIPAQFVKPFLKSQKNDYLDAEAIAEAVQRPTMVKRAALDRADQDARAARPPGPAPGPRPTGRTPHLGQQPAPRAPARARYSHPDRSGWVPAGRARAAGCR